jgi:hypothetical protein
VHSRKWAANTSMRCLWTRKPSWHLASTMAFQIGIAVHMRSMFNQALHPQLLHHHQLLIAALRALGADWKLRKHLMPILLLIASRQVRVSLSTFTDLILLANKILQPINAKATAPSLLRQLSSLSPIIPTRLLRLRNKKTRRRKRSSPGAAGEAHNSIEAEIEHLKAPCKKNLHWYEGSSSRAQSSRSFCHTHCTTYGRLYLPFSCFLL